MPKYGVYLQVVTHGGKILFETQAGLRFDLFPYAAFPTYNRMDPDLFGVGYLNSVLSVYIWKVQVDGSSLFGEHLATFGLVNRDDQRWSVFPPFKQRFDKSNPNGLAAAALQEGDRIYLDFLLNEEAATHFDTFLKRSAANFSAEARWQDDGTERTKVACLQKEREAVDQELRERGYIDFCTRLKHQKAVS